MGYPQNAGVLVVPVCLCFVTLLFLLFIVESANTQGKDAEEKKKADDAKAAADAAKAAQAATAAAAVSCN